MSSSLSINEKIRLIENTTDYKSVQWDWFPPAYSEEYYFVSYSHKDYKSVFKELFLMQSFNLNPISFWYDRELRIGKDWQIEASKHIYDYNCKGAVFFISENAVLSDSIHKEIEFIKKSGKAYLSINLPIKSISGHIGEYMSAESLLKILQPNLSKNDAKLKTLRETFNDRVTYLKLDDEIEKKILSIKKDLIYPPLFESSIKKYEKPEIYFDTQIDALNDNNAVVINESDFYNNNIIYPIKEIGNCVFANCKRLEKIDLPKSLEKITDYSFYGCKNLTDITIPNTVSQIGAFAFACCSSIKELMLPDRFFHYIGEYAFYKCFNLKSVIMLEEHIYTLSKGLFCECQSIEYFTIPKNVREIQDYAFQKCTSLKKIIIPDKVKIIGRATFEDCISLKEIEFGKDLESIDDYAFCGCNNILSIELPRKISVINPCTFSRCYNLKRIEIPKTVSSIGWEAFYDCKNLIEIIFEGTKNEWINIKKYKDWNYNMPTYTIYCFDGKIDNK